MYVLKHIILLFLIRLTLIIKIITHLFKNTFLATEIKLSKRW